MDVNPIPPASSGNASIPLHNMSEDQDEMNHQGDRLKILNMVAEGKITAADGASLLAALGQSRKSKPVPPAPSTLPAGKPRWFKVRVTDTVTGKAKASVTLPLGLVDWGLKIGAQFAPEVSGVNIETLSQALNSGIEGKLIDVVDEEDGEHVEIFVE